MAGLTAPRVTTVLDEALDRADDRVEAPYHPPPRAARTRDDADQRAFERASLHLREEPLAALLADSLARLPLFSAARSGADLLIAHLAPDHLRAEIARTERAVEPVVGTNEPADVEDAAQVVDFTTERRGSSEAEQLIRNQ